MAKPIAFASSADAPAVQIADLVAGATAAAVLNSDKPEFGQLPSQSFDISTKTAFYRIRTSSIWLATRRRSTR